MSQVVNKTVKLQLVGLDGNAYSIIGAFQKQARSEKWSKEEIDLVTKEMMSGDYDHLLQTAIAHCEEPEEDEDDDYNFEEGDDDDE